MTLFCSLNSRPGCIPAGSEAGAPAQNDLMGKWPFTAGKESTWYGRTGKTQTCTTYTQCLLSSLERAPWTWIYYAAQTVLNTAQRVTVCANRVQADKCGIYSVTEQFLVSGFWNCTNPLSFHQGDRIFTTHSWNNDFCIFIVYPAAFMGMGWRGGLGRPGTASSL